MASTAAPPDVERGAYLVDPAAGRLFWVAGAVREAVLLEDCGDPDRLEWWPVPVVLAKLERVSRT